MDGEKRRKIGCEEINNIKNGGELPNQNEKLIKKL